MTLRTLIDGSAPKRFDASGRGLVTFCCQNPDCGAKNRAPRSRLGKSVTCPKCGRQTAVDPSGKAPAVSSPPRPEKKKAAQAKAGHRDAERQVAQAAEVDDDIMMIEEAELEHQEVEASVSQVLKDAAETARRMAAEARRKHGNRSGKQADRSRQQPEP